MEHQGRPRLIKRLLRACGWVAVFLALVWGISFLVFDPPLEASRTYPSGIILRDRTGAVIRVGLGPGDQDCRPFYKADRRDWVVQALVAAEDKRFWSHHGIDPLSILRAIRQNLSTGRRISGASTITSQAVRLITPHPRTFFWKYAEAFQAMRMEGCLSKDEILEQYLNRAPLGSNLVGIEAGAMGWFGKPAKSLSLGEAALLIGMVQSPTRFRPDRHLNAALKRRTYVLDRMRALGLITPEQREGAESDSPVIRRAPRPFDYPFFADWAQATLTRTSGDFITTLDPTLQNATQTFIERRATELGCSGAGVIISVKTGAVRALACSDPYSGDEAGQVNTATAARPAGSTLKPFIMAAALDRGLVTPSEILADVPRHFGTFSPINFNGGFRGKVTASDALILSLNIPFMDLVTHVGLDEFQTVLHALGLNTIKGPSEQYGAGIAVGNAEVRLIDLANAYATLACGGVATRPQALDEQMPTSTRPPIFSAGACWLIAEMLSGHERSQKALGHLADATLPRVAWKTGTSAAYRDAWTVAWNPDYVVAVWFGHKSGNFGDASIVGADAAAPVAWSIFRNFYPSGRSPWFTKPEDVYERDICSLSGQPASSICPAKTRGFAIRGKSSPTLCTIHRLQSDGHVVENWPADIAQFLQAHGASNPAGKPAIVSPADRSVYKIIPGIASQAIAARADKIAAGTTLWWFLDSASIGTTLGNATLVIPPPAKGKHTLTCSTESGDSTTVTFSIE